MYQKEREQPEVESVVTFVHKGLHNILTHHSPTGSNTAAGAGVDTVPDATNASVAPAGAGPTLSSSITTSCGAAMLAKCESSLLSLHAHVGLLDWSDSS